MRKPIDNGQQNIGDIACFKKLLLLLAMLILIFALSGCRQRLSNNSEVGRTYDDKDGTKSEEYEARREALKLGIAKLSIFPDWGVTEEDDEFGSNYTGDTEELEEYEEEEPEEVDDEDHSTPAGNGGGGGTIRIPGIPGGSNKPDNLAVKLKITLDCQGGRSEASEIVVTKDAPYGALPEPYYAGYNFLGWYTAAEDGEQVTAETIVASDADHTLYAHWAEADVYTITLDPTGGTLVEEGTMLIKGGSKYGYLPTPSLEGKTFEGWYTAAEGGELVSKGDTFVANENLTLFAHWKDDPYSLWKNNFDDISYSVSEKACFISDPSKSEKSFIRACRGKIVASDASPAYVIEFVSSLGDAEAVATATLETFPDATVIVIPSSALNGGDKVKLYYQYMVLHAIHGGDAYAETVRSELGLDKGEIRAYSR